MLDFQSALAGSKIRLAADIRPPLYPPIFLQTHALNQISEQRANPERLLSSTLPDEGVDHCGGVLIVLGGGGGGGGRVEALAAGVEDEGVALVGEAEAAVLVHGRLPRAEEREGDGEEEADGHGVELVRLDLAGAKPEEKPTKLSPSGPRGRRSENGGRRRGCFGRPAQTFSLVFKARVNGIWQTSTENRCYQQQKKALKTGRFS